MKLKVGEDGSLFAKAGQALGFSFAGTAFSRLSTLAIGIALARILGPKEFGTFAVALVALLAVLSFNELGVSLAVVRWPGDPREIAPTVATISLLSSVLVYLGCFLGAPAFADAMGDPAAAPVIRLLALSVVIDGVVATPVAMLQRNFRQDRKMLADLISSWLNALTSIGCAVAGLGAMSLAVGQLVGAVCGAALFIRFAPQGMRLGFDPAKARALLRFGLPLAGSSVIVFAIVNLDKVIVGTVFGPLSLGFYVLAVNLSNWPVSIFSQPVRSVAPAALSRLRGDPAAMRATFLSTAGLLASVTVPACALLAATSQPLVRFVYGSAWGPAARVLPWLALLGALRILFELVYDYLVVLARTRIVFLVQVMWLVALAPALYLGSRVGGPPGAGAAQFVVGLLVVLPTYLYALRRDGISPPSLGARLAVPLLGGVGAALAAMLVARVTSVDLVALAGAGVAGLVAMGVLVHRMRGTLRSLRAVRAMD
jgi:O-antigen/teichoic acid export membrane protein